MESEVGDKRWTDLQKRIILIEFKYSNTGIYFYIKGNQLIIQD
jgi:hypothetical protein